MDSSEEVKFEQICDQLRQLFVDAYRRGGQEATDRILHIVGANEDGPFKPQSTQPILRAPRGSARRFVEKALASGPKSITEMRASAETDLERFLSYQTIRLELERGKAEKRYKKIKNKWHL
jgi:hypothetical protein